MGISNVFEFCRFPDHGSRVALRVVWHMCFVLSLELWVCVYQKCSLFTMFLVAWIGKAKICRGCCGYHIVHIYLEVDVRSCLVYAPLIIS
jgi:hypothetical protein